MMLTIIVPEAHMAAANHLGMCKGYSEADGLSYRGANWQDAEGNLYSTTSLMSHQFAADPMAHCERPVWDTDEVVDLTQATAAQGMIQLYTPSDPDSVKPTLGPDTIVVVRGPLPLDALAMMGISAVPQDETP
jgi:hypothetical protein